MHRSEAEPTGRTLSDVPEDDEDETRRKYVQTVRASLPAAAIAELDYLSRLPGNRKLFGVEIFDMAARGGYPLDKFKEQVDLLRPAARRRVLAMRAVDRLPARTRQLVDMRSLESALAARKERRPWKEIVEEAEARRERQKEGERLLGALTEAERGELQRIDARFPFLPLGSVLFDVHTFAPSAAPRSSLDALLKRLATAARERETMRKTVAALPPPVAANVLPSELETALLAVDWEAQRLPVGTWRDVVRHAEEMVDDAALDAAQQAKNEAAKASLLAVLAENEHAVHRSLLREAERGEHEEEADVGQRKRRKKKA